jgi:hypothetical protein
MFYEQLLHLKLTISQKFLIIINISKIIFTINITLTVIKLIQNASVIDRNSILVTLCAGKKLKLIIIVITC